MKIDIDKLTEAELTDLNHRIVARLRFLNQMRAHTEMLEFKISVIGSASDLLGKGGSKAC
jgi:hypothetical protein